MTDVEIITVIRGLMVADHLGDVHREIDRLRAGVGLPPLEGNTVHGWTPQDKAGVWGPDDS